MRRLRNTVLLVVAAVAAAMPLAAQAPAQKPSFEVASIKRSTPDARGPRMGATGGRFFATNVTLRVVLINAYRPKDGPLLKSQLIGLPSWADTDYFDIEAKTEDAGPGPIPQDKLQPMLQSLLEDRFQLKAHWETRDLPVYILTVAKGGLKLKLSEDQTPPAPVTSRPPQRPGEPPVLPRGVFSLEIPAPSEMRITGTAIPFRNIVNFLQAQLGQRIFDKTDLKGLFDIRLQFANALSANPTAVSTTAEPGPPPEPSAPSLAVALDELGLKLESAKAPLQVLVIDSVQKPSEN